MADDIRPILEGDESPEIPLLLVLDGVDENDDPAVWSRIGWAAGLPGNVRVWVSADNDLGVTDARWGEALHWLNDWSDVVLETPPERSVAALPGDVDADTVCVLSAASGPISEAELVRIVGGDQADARVSATLRKLEPWLSLSENDRLRLWRAIRPAVSEADALWTTPLLNEADRAVARLGAAGATVTPSAHERDRRALVVGELKSRRVVRAPVIGALRRIAERLRFPAREEVLLLAARRLAGLPPESRASWAALLAPLYPEERRAERLADVDAQISALPKLEDRLDVLTERLQATSAGASAIIQRAMGWLLSSDRFPLMAQRFLFHVPEGEWNRCVPEEARALVRRWRGESRGSADSLGPLRCGQLPQWLVAEVQEAPLAELKERTDVSDRNYVASELVSWVTADVRAELARMFFSVPPEAFRGEDRAIENWAESATLEELRYIHQEVLPCMGSRIDDALAALSLRAAELGDRDLAASFCAAMEGADDRHQADVEVALALGSFSDVERLVRPDLEDEDASGTLEMVGKALKSEEHAASFAELVRGAARASNRLSAWAAVFPSLSFEARERLSTVVVDTVKEALREPPEASDESLCGMFRWMSEESLCDVWRGRASPENWRPTIAETTPLFTYDRGYGNGACLDTLLLRLGGEAALVAWARTLDELDDWLSEIGPGPE